MMTRRDANAALSGATLLAATGLHAQAAAPEPRLLPAPRTEGGMPLMSAPVDTAGLGVAMHLRAGQFVTFAQTVGYPQQNA